MPVPPLALHLTASVIALAALGIFSVDKLPNLQAGVTSEPLQVDIAIEHIEPISMDIEISTLGGVAIADISQKGEENTLLSVPNYWVQREVRGVPIDQANIEDETFGFTRWNLPDGATISFRIKRSPDSMTLHNPTNSPMKVSVTRVNLETQEVVGDVILVQEGSTKLW